MAKLSLVQQASNILITSYVERLVVRVELATERSTAARYGGMAYPWSHFGKVEFVNREEWDFLKALTQNEDDETLSKSIYNNPRFRSHVSGKYEFMSMKIVFSDTRFGSFCKIEAKDMTIN